ncbi:N-acetylmuramoyl-L-alanine amidase family protein [Clostridium botulinum]|uniref:N-acetylmuramoyl-L-alanine amidase n=2 Tax=Clostridium botulinum TaxID=1491 RepID=C1FLR9_CLOBJ|nr:N-acetylmuramoyl-L-alanine amidase [Clostridium botulinum]ACO86844.1 N-acetylmuramoyl-L-alanine amidase [Clostridium botulinum A2 str. Kyoto]APC81088.1 N-acetylmuramoyl-L-alanine amidase family protein [Clostridium botulinum]APC82982.1 N-acetylmuramoyl-L-alanine amidase family protein [Clostridium botulinum]AUN06592.1 N-acetylmuramoyl-L-alanine amidase [Clostridium botulinum]AXG95168.1 N-acetylmuramoyl-L-alanine amidase [Clostridium botulinum]
MKKKIVLVMCVITLLLFSACTSKENFNKKVGEEKKVVNKEEESQKKKENAFGKNNEEKEHNDILKEKKEDKSKENLKNKIIVIDPGHGSKSNLELERVSPDSEEKKIKDGGGAEGVNSKTPEYLISMDVASKLKETLQKEGYTVIMTKNKHSESLGNIERAEVGNKNNANLVIRIHADSADLEDAKGASILVPSKKGYASEINELSKKYGDILLREMVASANMNNRGVIEREDMTGFNWSKVPVVLVEMGFLSNAEEDKLLNTEEYRIKIVQGLTKGIKKAIN